MIKLILSSFLLLAGFTNCEKLIEIDSPVNSITTTDIFSNNKQAEWAIASLYSKMINGTVPNRVFDAANSNFAAGLTTLIGALASDDLYHTSAANNTSAYAVNSNTVTTINATLSNTYWQSAYKIIYDANAVIEGVAAATSPSFQPNLRKQLTGEALVIRAFAHFYLTNIFGDIPLITTIDFNQTKNLPRIAQSKIYKQIKEDLIAAIPNLPSDFSAGKGERIRINKWFAEGLLARVQLYTGDYSAAINHATAIINQTALFELVDINSVFTKNSKEALWQLQSTNENISLSNATPEGRLLNQSSLTNLPLYQITPSLLQQFETGDVRKINWIKSHLNGQANTIYAPSKYKTGATNSKFNGVQEYYTVMRLAELFLIRAEAYILQSDQNIEKAIDDLNAIRKRAQIDPLPENLTAQQLVDAIAKERQTEFFVEWGHRWFDLKRTGNAEAVLSQISYKKPWLGKYQLLHPIPVSEIMFNSSLEQNPEYSRL